MTLKHFIERPVLASVISILIVIAGLVGLKLLPVEQYPDIAPASVYVSASYPGASAETLQKSVVIPLEEAINGVEDMMYIKSSASNAGSATITVYFHQGTNPDMAAINVQNRVATVTGQLPAEVNRIGVTTQKRQSSMLKIFSLYSTNEAYDDSFLSNYMRINIQPRILRTQGVGEFMVLGSEYSIRIWLKPDLMAQYGMIPADVTTVLNEQNIEAAVGVLGENSENSFQYTMKYRGRLTQPEEFEQIVVKSLPNGEMLRLKDIAEIELGKNSYSYKGFTNGYPGVSAMVYQTAGSNATQVIEDIEDLLDEIETDLPEGIKIAHLQSVNDFLYASINEVLKTLIEAIILVVLIVYIFLQDIRSTLIPTIAILVALIGTFGFLSIAGFSINLLTLFALVLAIGTVVDDAIIVVEAVQARFDVGYKSSYMATIDAMSGITSAIVTSTLVFMAVFIPVAMMGGTSGTFYTQFGITMAVAVGFSAINALTLSPALCALILKPYLDENGEMRDNFAARFRKAFNTSFTTMVNKYKYGVLVFIRHRWLMWSTLAVAFGGLYILMNNTKTGLVPDEDLGSIMVNVTAAPGTSLKETSEILDRVVDAIKDIPQVKDYNQVAGYGMMAGQGSSYGLCIVKLKDWADRPDKADEVKAVIGQIYARTAHIKDAQVFAVAPPMISGYGSSAGFEMYLQDKAGGKLEDFYNIYLKFVGALNQRPEIGRAYSTFAINFPQYIVDLDAAQAKRVGVSPNVILSTLSGYYGGQYVSNINRFSKVYRVMLQADPEHRLDKESLDNIFVRTQSGEMAPINQFVTLHKAYGPEVINRFNMYNCISVNGMAADGYSSGDAIKAIEEVAEATLPKGYGFEFGGLTREESQTESNTAVIFRIYLLLLYLILSALYESFIVPFAVILSVPCGLLGSFLFAKFMGLENNIYLQTGLIMLIGLLAKTAILLTEYATDRRKAGMSLTQAAVSAAKVRLRPILMTVLTMVFGMIPLVLSQGAGANGNSTLGSGVVGGMIIGTLALLFLVPTLFIVFQTLQEKISPTEMDLDPQWSVRAELEDTKEEKEK